MAGGKEAVLRDASGRAVLRYTDLHVVDAAGRELPAQIEVGAGGLSIRFEDVEAAYPVTVDPLMWVQEAELPGVVNSSFGSSVAVSGDTAVVGADTKNSQTGVAYVFVRSGSAWSQQKTLDSVGLNFGASVAMSGDTLVVGAPGGDRAAVYVGSGSSWPEQQGLTASDGVTGDSFGCGVALSADGNTAVVGAREKAMGKGAAYVFVRSGSSWTQQQELIASDGLGGDNFGYSVAVSGDTAVVGAFQKRAAYVFVRSGTSWTQQQELTASDGTSGDYFGLSVAVNGDTALVGAPYHASKAGAAYVFVRSGTSWMQQQELAANDGAVDDYFGWSVTVGMDTALVGADGHAAGRGAAYVFGRAGTFWTQQQEMTANDGAANDSFGVSVALSGDTALVGADQKASTEGAVYVFVLPGALCSLTTDCQSGFCVDGVCCTVPACMAADDCHDPGTCQVGTGMCSNPAKPDGAMCSLGTCQAGACAPSPDAGPDSGTSGGGGFEHYDGQRWRLDWWS